MIHLETPLNPTGEASYIKHFADKAHRRGAYLIVDSTFGPPGIQEPFALGPDMIMIIYSSTNYFSRNYDLLCGTLSIQPATEANWLLVLHGQRTILGSVLGNMEAWLSFRGLRIIELRIRRQSENADRLVRWINQHLIRNDGNIINQTVAGVRHM